MCPSISKFLLQNLCDFTVHCFYCFSKNRLLIGEGVRPLNPQECLSFAKKGACAVQRSSKTDPFFFSRYLLRILIGRRKKNAPQDALWWTCVGGVNSHILPSSDPFWRTKPFCCTVNFRLSDLVKKMWGLLEAVVHSSFKHAIKLKYQMRNSVLKCVLTRLS